MCHLKSDLFELHLFFYMLLDISVSLVEGKFDDDVNSQDVVSLYS